MASVHLVDTAVTRDRPDRQVRSAPCSAPSPSARSVFDLTSGSAPPAPSRVVTHSNAHTRTLSYSTV